ncbi:MAG: hypothetical protein GTO14_04965 [Anaerolineales bacterium]|nr:hypothetical protein [Anaerolineales bacterium]
MRLSRFTRICFPGIMILIAALACEFPGGDSEDQRSLQATETMRALATEVGRALEPKEPREGEKPVEPDVPEDVLLTPTPTSTPTHTPATSALWVSVSVDTNCRAGPGEAYEYLGALLIGEKAEVIARNSGGTYFYIYNPDFPPEFCWLWGQFADVEGEVSILPVFTPPPPPAPTPTPTPTPGLVVRGHVRLGNGTGVSGVAICRSFASYPGVHVATTDSTGYYETNFAYIPGDEMITVWAYHQEYVFDPEYHYWRHYFGFEDATRDFTAALAITHGPSMPDCR